MATRVAAFTVKIRSLYDYQLRLLHGVMPSPSGIDIANTLKYFSQTLLTVLRDVSDSPLEMLKDIEMDQKRLSLYPCLDYKGLYNALLPFGEVGTLVQNGIQEFGQSLLQCWGCLLLFLDRDMIDNLPYVVASLTMVFPKSLHQDVINLLCYYVLPFTITRYGNNEEENCGAQTLSGILMLILQYSSEPAHHCQLVECLMGLRSNILKAVLCVIAYGAIEARANAAKLLFYYWPAFDANLFDKRGLLSKFAGNAVPFVCQRSTCPNSGNVEASKVCYDHRIAIACTSDSPPPLYLCIECANEVHRENPDRRFFDILHMMQQVSMICENKNCRSTDKSAYSVCFSTECASYNGNHPIRYCQYCHNNRHNVHRGVDHIVHKSVPTTWSMDVQMQSYMVEAIVSLLREAEMPQLTNQPNQTSTVDVKSDAKSESKVIVSESPIEGFTLEERQYLGRYGIWLLVGRCLPTPDAPPDVLARLLSMLFHWFYVTSFINDGQLESTLEKLKNDHVYEWLRNVCEHHYKLFISCFLPHPCEYVRVGGHWDTFSSRTCHLKNGFHRLFCLIPYRIITPEIWNYIMPYWMEACVNDVPEKELSEFKVILNKIMDPKISPLKFDGHVIYNFIDLRFHNTAPKIQEQALHWLQVLTIIEVHIPLEVLFSMFESGVRGIASKEDFSELQAIVKHNNDNQLGTPRRNSVVISTTLIDDNKESSSTTSISDDSSPTTKNPDNKTDSEQYLSCYIFMLDILLKQLELHHNSDKHAGINSELCKNVCRLLKCMIQTEITHSCTKDAVSYKADCAMCESNVIWHQLCLDLIIYISPVRSAHPPDIIEEPVEDAPNKADPEKKEKSDVVISMPIPESVGGVLVHMPHVCSIMTATVETVSEQLDLGGILPVVPNPEKSVTSVGRTTTFSESDSATSVQLARYHIIDENDINMDDDDEEQDNGQDYWQTSVGKFQFNINALPEHFQYIHQLLKELSKTEKPNTLYYILQCLNILALNGDAFTRASKNHYGFFIWCQENILIKSLWSICNAEYSHICEYCVPLLLHCVTLPAGSDVFWSIVQEEFHSSDWKVRFVAVERITVIVRFMDSTPLRGVVPLQAALANAFCYLISSMDDVNVYVAQRATLYLGTIHDYAIKSLILCLETQFDSVVIDRPMVLQSIYQLHNCLSDRRILSWDFFLNRFDTLFLEAQIMLEKMGETTYMRDLRNTDANSEVFSRKVSRAYDALAQSDANGSGSLKTLSASFGTKWPYKRTMSAPASFFSRQEARERDRTYNRQFSAPLLKRRTSRFGLSQFAGKFSTIDSCEGIGPPVNLNDENSLMGYLTRIVDLEESDRETIHLLVFLMMQFLSRTDQAYPCDDKPFSRPQNTVLKHLYLLLGYNLNERAFFLTPARLRSSPVFNSFMSNLPQLMDQNHLIGGDLISFVLSLLKYSPSPYQESHLNGLYDQHSVSDSPLIHSLWFLDVHIRHSWLMALLVILYKYQYYQPTCSAQLQLLVKIVLKTLDNQQHHCRRIPATIVMPESSFRSRDVSQPSLGQESEILNTPPLSPTPTSKPKNILMRINGSLTTSMESQDAEKGSKPTSKDHSIRSQLEKKAQWIIGTVDDDMPSLKKCIMPFASTLTKFDVSVDQDSPTVLNAAPPTAPSGMSGALSGAISGAITGTAFEMASAASITASAVSITASITPTTVVTKTTTAVTTKTTTAVTTKTTPKISTKTASMTEPPPKWSNMKKRLSVGSTEIVNAMASTVALSEAVTTMCANDLLKEEGEEKPVLINILQRQQKTHSLLMDQTERHEKSDRHSEKHDKEKHGLQTKLLGNQVFSVAFANKFSLMQQPPIERLLPIGESKLSTVNTPRTPYPFTLDNGSPESPLSKMKIHMIESPDSGDSETSQSSVKSQTPLTHTIHVQNVQNVHKLEIPMPERLLPIGQGPENMKELVQKIRQALGVLDECKECKEAEPLKSPKPRNIDVGVKEASRSASPRRLMKQPALESPPGGIPGLPGTAIQWNEGKVDKKIKQQESVTDVVAKKGPASSSKTSRPDHLFDKQSEMQSSIELKQCYAKSADESVIERCGECGTIIEHYSDEELGLCIIVLGTFVHREAALAAPLLPEILNIVAKIAVASVYPWQCESSIHLPGGAISVAHQFLRCVLHQLAPNGVFTQIFLTRTPDAKKAQFFHSITQALLDFSELSPIVPLQLLLETLNAKKSLSSDNIPTIVKNIACYLECVPGDVGLTVTMAMWVALITQIETFFRRITLLLHQMGDLTPLLQIMVAVLKLPNCFQFKGLLDPFSKVLSVAIEIQPVEYHYIVDLCYLCYRTFTKERDKLILCRMVVYQLVQAFKFKTPIPDSNFVLILSFLLQDVGGSIPYSWIFPQGGPNYLEMGIVFNTGIADCMKLHIGDALEFLVDFHTISRLKTTWKQGNIPLNEDTFGGILKCAVAQYLALEITHNNRDNRSVQKFLPWLYNTPATYQQGQRDFIEWVGHIRLLSWLLLGSLVHTGLHYSSTHLSTNTIVCQPIPQDASCHIADHIQLIMSGFAEQSKLSVLHMSSLFHAFMLCQLWTIYLEQNLCHNLPISEAYNTTMSILFDFWGKVTPCILHLISYSKVLADMVNLHFLSMVEALLECQSTFLSKLLPLWTPVLYSHQNQLPGSLQMRLQTCRNFTPHVNVNTLTEKQKSTCNTTLLSWLQRLQFKMGQIELQSSTATQFYSI